MTYYDFQIGTTVVHIPGGTMTYDFQIACNHVEVYMVRHIRRSLLRKYYDCTNVRVTKYRSTWYGTFAFTTEFDTSKLSLVVTL